MASTIMYSKQIGDISEAFVAAKCLAKGWQVYKPISDGRSDLVISRDGVKLERMQIKTGKYKDGSVHVHLRSAGYTVSKRNITTFANDYIGEVDLFGAYCPQLGTVYVFDTPSNNTLISLRVDPLGAKQSPSQYHFAKDFQI